MANEDTSSASQKKLQTTRSPTSTPWLHLPIWGDWLGGILAAMIVLVIGSAMLLESRRKSKDTRGIQLNGDESSDESSEEDDDEDSAGVVSPIREGSHKHEGTPLKWPKERPYPHYFVMHTPNQSALQSRESSYQQAVLSGTTACTVTAIPAIGEIPAPAAVQGRELSRDRSHFREPVARGTTPRLDSGPPSTLVTPVASFVATLAGGRASLPRRSQSK
jgi:hypothetical protein